MSGRSTQQYFDETQLTEKKQKEMRLKQLAEQIKKAEAQVQDYSVFLCSVSPEQTMVELESLRGVLRWGTQEYAAVRNLSTSIRNSLDRCTSLDYRSRWEKIANVADDVSAAATGRRAESNLEVVRTHGSASPHQPHVTALYQALTENKRSSPLARNYRSATPISVAAAPPTVEVFVESLARTSPSRGATTAAQSATKRLPLVSPLKEVLNNDFTTRRTGSEERASLQEDYRTVENTPLLGGLDVPRSRSRSWLLPPPTLSAERDDPHPAPPARYNELFPTLGDNSGGGFVDASPRRDSAARVRSEPREYYRVDTSAVQQQLPSSAPLDTIQAPAAVPLSSHALAQREIRDLEQHYEAKLDDAHALWRRERSDLVSKMEHMERLMREQHALEKAELTEVWHLERSSLVQGQSELRDELRESKEATRGLEDQMDKLKQIVVALQHRLGASEDRSNTLQEQHRVLHDTLSRAVAAAPSSLNVHIASQQRQGSRSPTKLIDTAVGLTAFTAPSTDALRGMGLIGVGDVSGLTSAIRSPTSDRDRFRRVGSMSSYETISPGRTSPR